MRNRYNRSYTFGVADWPGVEAEDETWEVVSPIEEPGLLPAIGQRVECIWVVCNVEYKTIRQSLGFATMVGDREWRNDAGSTLVFNPSFWRSPR